MKTDKKAHRTAKLELNAETLMKLDDLSEVNGGITNGDIVITRKGEAAAGSWLACCQGND